MDYKWDCILQAFSPAGTTQTLLERWEKVGAFRLL